MGLLLLAQTATAATTDLHIEKVAGDGKTVLSSKDIDYAWMEANLPVYGDGMTHYYHQGPVFVESKEGQWDPNETANFKDMGAVKGTAVRDLCLAEIPSPPLRIILMYEQNGTPLSFDDGGPARIAITSEQPGVITEGSAWVKWVDRIEIRD